MNIAYNIDWLLRGWLMSIIIGSGFKFGCELGTYQGGATFFLLDNIEDLTLHTVDIFEQQPDHESYKDKRYDFTDRYPKFMEKAKNYKDRLVVYKGWTHEVVKQIPDKTYDFVFIDADHSYEGCKRDIVLWGPKVREGGLLMGHDANLESVAKAVKDCCTKIHIHPGNLCWVGSCE